MNNITNTFRNKNNIVSAFDPRETSTNVSMKNIVMHH